MLNQKSREMKKLSIIVGLALVMLTAACSKDAASDLNPSHKTILGVGIDNSQSRTYIGDANADGTYPVLWSEGDKVAVNGEAIAVDSKYVGSSYLKLEATAAAEYKLAYPAELIDGDVLTISEVQKFVEGSFAVGSGVLVGYSQTEEIMLKNLYGYLKFTVADAANVDRVTVVAKGGEAISGTFAIDYKNAAIAPLAGKDIIRVTDVVAANGVATVVVAVPAGEYAQGFSVKVYDKSNGVMTKSLKGAGATVEAGVIYTMPQLAFAATATEKLIMTAEDFVDFVTLANGSLGFDKWLNADGEVKLGADIDLQGVTLPSIASFTAATFNGQGFAIKNWHSATALFTRLEADAAVKNLVIDQSCSVVPDLSTANTHHAILVAYANGLVEGCVNNADFVINSSLTRAGGTRFGALIASGYGRVRDCVNNGDINITFPALDPQIFVGGIVGYYNPAKGQGQSEEFIKDCINNGSITVLAEDQPSKAHIGGVIGATTLSTLIDEGVAQKVSSEGTIIRCYNNGNIHYEFRGLGTGTYSNIGGVVGYCQAYIKECVNEGQVKFTTPKSESAGGSRPAVGGVVASTLFSVTDCVNRGEIYVDGTWTAGTTGAEATGGLANPNFGGIVGSIGRCDSVTDNTLSNCQNYGKITLYPSITSTAGSHHYFGGVAGFASVNVSNCDNYGEMTCTSNAIYTYCGGVVGYTYEGATLSNSSNRGAISLTHDLSTTGRPGIYSGEDAFKTFCAGVISYAKGAVTNCHNYGAVVVDDATRSLNCGGAVGYATATSPVSYCSNSAAVTCSMNHPKNVLTAGTYEGANPYHYIGGVAGNGAGNVSDCINNEGGVLTVNSNTQGDFGGVVGYTKGHNLNLENKAPVTIDFSYLGEACANQIMIGGVIGKNYASNENNKVNVSSCTNSGKLTIKNHACTDSFSYFGGIIGSNDSGLATIKDCSNTGDIEFDGPSAIRLGGVAGYTACKLNNSSFEGKITTKRVKYVSSSRMANIGGLIGYTAQGIVGGFVNCVIDAQGDEGIYVGGVIGASGNDTWSGLVVKADISTSANAYVGLLIGGELASSNVTVNIGTSSSAVSILKSSKLQGSTIKANGTDPLSGMPQTLICNPVNVLYIN